MDENEVKQALEDIRPLLQRDGGDLEFVAVNNGIVQIRLKGMCAGCPMAQMTVKQGSEVRLKEKLPELEAVETV